MDLAVARARLERMTQWSASPALVSAEIDDLLLIARRVDARGYAPEATWAASTAYTRGIERIPTVNNGHIYEVITAGTSGASQPAWPLASGATVTDGTVVWRESGLYEWTPTYDLKAAAALGWEWKAGKVAAQYDASVGNQTSFYRSQQFKHCMAMAARYRGGSVGAIQMQGAYTRGWES